MTQPHRYSARSTIFRTGRLLAPSITGEKVPGGRG